MAEKPKLQTDLVIDEVDACSWAHEDMLIGNLKK
jgi:hypothetical protein